jgi:DNA invertase Pin-like site-specific DNA recombinase
MEPRAQLDAAVRSLRKGDILVVTKLDRLARSLAHAICIESRISDKGASLEVLDPHIDTSQPIGRLLFNMIGAVAQFEREIMLERQREGIAKAQREGKYKGRAPTAERKTEQIHELAAQGIEKTEIARRLGISRASVYRYLPREGKIPARRTCPIGLIPRSRLLALCDGILFQVIPR